MVLQGKRYQTCMLMFMTMGLKSQRGLKIKHYLHQVKEYQTIYLMCGLFHVCDGLIKKEEKNSKEIVNCLSVLHAVCPCIMISESPKKNQNSNEKTTTGVTKQEHWMVREDVREERAMTFHSYDCSKQEASHQIKWRADKFFDVFYQHSRKQPWDPMILKLQGPLNIIHFKLSCR